ncbi:MAG: crossover junction endodeoxyribonuclease RuvC [Pseudomonadota bacterium]
MRVIGLDPGLRRTGWGLVESKQGRLCALGHGVIPSGTGSLAERLACLYDALEEIIARTAPDMAAVEQTFVNRDAAGTLKLGQARAVALLVPARAGIPVAEYAPNTVKKTVVGVGHADKAQVEHMVRFLLPGVRPGSTDAADALAIAICHAWTAGTRQHQTAALARTTS